MVYFQEVCLSGNSQDEKVHEKAVQTIYLRNTRIFVRSGEVNRLTGSKLLNWTLLYIHASGLRLYQSHPKSCATSCRHIVVYTYFR